MKKYEKVLLNAEQFKELAVKQGDILEDIQLIRNLMYYMPASGNYVIDEQIGLIHSKLQGMAKALDHTTFILYNTTDKEELEAFGIVLDPETKTGE